MAAHRSRTPSVDAAPASTPALRVRLFRPADLAELVRMSEALFPGQVPEEAAAEMRALLDRPDAAIFVLERSAGGSLAGFVEVGTRSHADGCTSSPVGYIEAWYVDPDVRRGGHGRALLEAAEEWARARGYTEMASDALLDNHVSHEAHRRSGYVEIDRVVTYRKALGTDGRDR